MTRLLALGVVLVALAGAAPAGGKVGTLYALRYGAQTNLLVPYDPVRLVPSGAPSIRTGSFGHAWSISPDRTRFVAAAGWRPTPGHAAAIRFVDLAAGRVEGTVSLPAELGRIVGTAWVRGRVLAVAAGTATTVYSIDPNERKVVGRVTVPGVVVLGERAPSGLVLLLAPRDRIGPATLAVVDRALRKNVDGVVRNASTLPDGRLVLSGFDYGIRAAGVWLVDPRDWSSRALDREGSWYEVGGGLVFARGERGLGLRIVQPSGTVREFFAGRTVATLEVVGPRALVIFAGTNQRAAVVELYSGRVIRQSVPARPLVGAGQPIYG